MKRTLKDTEFYIAALMGYCKMLDDIGKKIGEVRKIVLAGRGRTVRPRKRFLSAEGRAKIAAAQRERWAKAKKAAQ